jgi:hypothetical protein
MNPVFLRLTPLLAACVLLVACGTSGSGPMRPTRIEIGERPYLVSPLTASTWTVSSPSNRQTLPRDAGARTAQLQAIEKISGCRVSDSNYSDDGLQLDAQVECPGLTN